MSANLRKYPQFFGTLRAFYLGFSTFPYIFRPKNQSVYLRVHFTEVVPNNQLFWDIYALKNENYKMRNSQFFVRSFDFSSTKLVTKHFSATKKRWKTYANRFFEVFCRENTEIRYAFCKLGDLRLHDKFMDTWLFCEGNTTGMCTQNTSGLTKTFC